MWMSHREDDAGGPDPDACSSISARWYWYHNYIRSEHHTTLLIDEESTEGGSTEAANVGVNLHLYFASSSG